MSSKVEMLSKLLKFQEKPDQEKGQTLNLAVEVESSHLTPRPQKEKSKEKGSVVVSSCKRRRMASLSSTADSSSILVIAPELWNLKFSIGELEHRVHARWHDSGF